MLSPKRIFAAFGYTLKGLKSAWRSEAAFRDNIVLVVLAQSLCVYLQPQLWLWLIFGLSNSLLLTAELLNTGLEYLADHISTEQHVLLGSAKDVGSAAVFILLMFNALVFAVVLFQ